MTPYSILIIENHPFIVNSYIENIEKILSKNKTMLLSIDIASYCDEAMNLIKNSKKNNHPYDLVISGVCIPVSEKEKQLFGEDLCIKIKTILTKVKLIILTRIECNFRVRSIIKRINPDALLLKKDFSQREFKNAISLVISNTPYYSKSVLELLRKEISNDFLLDQMDRQLLYELSIGTKMKLLPKILPMSMRGIDKRKQKLKDMFNINPDDDRGLILEAMENGLI